MKKSNKNSIINGLMLICMSAITGTGFLIKYTLISGQKRWNVYGDNVKLNLLGMDRHQWGEIHLIIGIIFLGLLTIHLILHWKTITSVCSKFFNKSWVFKIITIVVLILCSVLIIGPFLIEPNIISVKKGEGRQVKTNIEINKTDRELSKNYQQKEMSNSKKTTSNIGIKGSMSIAEVSKKYNIPTHIIKTKLNLNTNISDNEKFGRLRKKYDFKMGDVEKLIKAYRK